MSVYPKPEGEANRYTFITDAPMKDFSQPDWVMTVRFNGQIHHAKQDRIAQLVAKALEEGLK